MNKDLHYLRGFHNHHSSEALPNALPLQQNTPQQCPYGLYAEQINGTAFTANRADNLRTWLYRIKPSVSHTTFKTYPHKLWVDTSSHLQTPEQTRWEPIPYPDKKTDFIDGQITFALNGSIANKQGGAIQLFAINQSMQNTCFSNSDAESLIIIESGTIRLLTEMGILMLTQNEIAIIPRGIKFSVQLDTKQARGYMLENFGIPFTLPELGVVGANGLANPRDFLYPAAFFIDEEKSFTHIVKFQGKFWQTTLSHNPFNVVAWHGNYAPYKYNLLAFNAINSVNFDHTDPSIFTVLTSPSCMPNTANIDFVIFPERWVVQEHTFRPPYYHRNSMSEFMGLIKGVYDAKTQDFKPGGASLHNCMSAHGPDSQAFTKASTQKLVPTYYKDTLAFMFESSLVWQQTDYAMKSPLRQKNYLDCWKDLPKCFHKD